MLKKLKIKEYKIFPNGDAKIYDDVDIGKIVSELAANKVHISSINSSDESVEEYYLNLVKGVAY